MREQIIEACKRIEEEEGVQIIYAAESGSRAWGFASPDSDYDVRFIYKRKTLDYLSLETPRDVIERPIIDDLDFHGWDIYKACQLFRKSNPSLLEWLYSPIVYIERSEFANHLRDLATTSFSLKRAGYHYLHIASSHHKEWIQQKDHTPLKKYLYVLRTLLAVNWLAQRRSPVPTSIRETLAGVEIEIWVRERVEHFLYLKQTANEADVFPEDRELNDWIQHQLVQMALQVTQFPDPYLGIEQLDTWIWQELGLR